MVASSASPAKVSRRLGAGLGLRLPTRAVLDCGVPLLGVSFDRGVRRFGVCTGVCSDLACAVGSCGMGRAAAAARGSGMYMLSSSDEDSCTTFWCCATCWCRSACPLLAGIGP